MCDLNQRTQPQASFCDNDSFEVDKWKCKQVLMIPKRLSSNTNFPISCVLVVVLGTSLFQRLNHQVGFSYSGIRLKPRDLVFHVRIAHKIRVIFLNSNFLRIPSIKMGGFFTCSYWCLLYISYGHFAINVSRSNRKKGLILL